APQTGALRRGPGRRSRTRAHLRRPTPDHRVFEPGAVSTSSAPTSSRPVAEVIRARLSCGELRSGSGNDQSSHRPSPCEILPFKLGSTLSSGKTERGFESGTAARGGPVAASRSTVPSVRYSASSTESSDDHSRLAKLEAGLGTCQSRFHGLRLHSAISPRLAISNRFPSLLNLRSLTFSSNVASSSVGLPTVCTYAVVPLIQATRLPSSETAIPSATLPTRSLSVQTGSGEPIVQRARRFPLEVKRRRPPAEATMRKHSLHSTLQATWPFSASRTVTPSSSRVTIRRPSGVRASSPRSAREPERRRVPDASYSSHREAGTRPPRRTRMRCPSREDWKNMRGLPSRILNGTGPRICQELRFDAPRSPAASTRSPSWENASRGSPGAKLKEVRTLLDWRSTTSAW